ncbi:MAG: cytochrome c class I [Cyclobacteriaceae bacterium]|nr:cytochrome c class I [Cyclobacteriaceae bacterium]
MKGKSIVWAMALGAVILACGSKTETQAGAAGEDYGTPEQGTSAALAGPDIIAQGEALVKSSDCKTCHHAVNKIIGPSHTDVAKKYEFTEANVKYLAGKIKTGGSGVWGETPMNAHPDLSDADAEKMARYVLSLDGEKEH